MDALRLGHLDRGSLQQIRQFSYAAPGLSIDPDPPQVGQITTITFYLANSDSHPITVSSIEARVAHFGMGVTWEELPPLGPFHLPADPQHIEQARLEWIPRSGGHRCLRATIHVEGQASPWYVGCNLRVIEAASDERSWSVPFRLGNPTAEPQPLRLSLAQSGTQGVYGHLTLRQGERRLPLQTQDWLQPHEEREGLLLIRALTPEAFESVSDVQAWLGEQFLDGIRVVVRRPAFVHRERPEPDVNADLALEELLSLRVGQER